LEVQLGMLMRFVFGREQARCLNGVLGFEALLFSGLRVSV